MAVKYVAAPKTEKGKISIGDAVILEVRGEGRALLDLTPRNAKGEAADPDKAPLGHHVAESSYSEDHAQENTFHFADEPATPASGTNGSGKTAAS
jgi:hypothetical protein